MLNRLIATLSLAVAPLLGCATEPQHVEATSLTGAPLERPTIPAERRPQLEAQLDAARAEFERRPDSEVAAIWFGRRLGYVGRYRDALRHFTNALERHPHSYRLLRHRGHRFITLRDFESAVDDLERAAALSSELPDEIEPDGAPNPLGIPTSSTWFNIQYHLGLAHYLQADYNTALQAFESSLESPLTNDDKLVASTHWMWLCLLQLGRDTEAHELIDGVPRELDVIENHSYAALIELYREVELDAAPDPPDLTEDPSAAAYAYGFAEWLRARGDAARADRLLRDIVTETSWPSFGHIAAEARLARLESAGR